MISSLIKSPRFIAVSTMAAVAPCLRPVRRISKNDSSITQRNRDFIICKSFATAATPAAIQIARNIRKCLPPSVQIRSAMLL